MKTISITIDRDEIRVLYRALINIHRWERDHYERNFSHLDLITIITTEMSRKFNDLDCNTFCMVLKDNEIDTLYEIVSKYPSSFRVFRTDEEETMIIDIRTKLSHIIDKQRYGYYQYIYTATATSISTNYIGSW